MTELADDFYEQLMLDELFAGRPYVAVSVKDGETGHVSFAKGMEGEVGLGLLAMTLASQGWSVTAPSGETF